MKYKKHLLVFSITIILLGASGVGGVCSTYIVQKDILPASVQINGIDVSNISRQTAMQKIVPNIDGQLQNTVLELTYRDERFSVPLEDMDIQCDFDATVNNALNARRSGSILRDAFITFKERLQPPETVNVIPVIQYNGKQFAQQLETIKCQIDRECMDASLRVVNDRVEIIPEIPGRTLHIEQTLSNIGKKLGYTSTIELVVQEIMPNVFESDLAGIREIIGEFKTIIPEANLKNCESDIDKVVSAVNQLIVKSGGKISLLELLKEKVPDVSRTENPAVNQMVSTLYNALLLSDIAITERTAEKHVVDYIEAGREAVIEEPYIDFIFENDKDFPILLLASRKNNEVTIKIFGTITDRNLRVKVETRNKVGKKY